MKTEITREFEFIEKTREIPENADYCLTLTDCAMEPFFLYGEKVYITYSKLPKEFQVGVFMYKDRVVCRQWCEDYAGALHLLCPNTKNAAMNLTVPREELGKCLCLGSVITQKILPPPEYYE